MHSSTMIARIAASSWRVRRTRTSKRFGMLSVIRKTQTPTALGAARVSSSLQAVNLAVLGLEVLEIRRRIQTAARDALQQFGGGKLAPMLMQVCAQPAQQRSELAVFDLAGQIGNISVDLVPQLQRDQIAQ